MSLDEFLFKTISNYNRRSKERKMRQQASVVWLEHIQSRLILVARALTGAEIEIYTAEREGGYKNLNFFLPEYCNLFEEKAKNEQFYLYRTLYLALQWQLQLNWQPNENFSDAVSRQKGEEMSDEVLEKMFSEFPFYKPFFNELEVAISQIKDRKSQWDRSFLFGKWMRNNNLEIPISNNQIPKTETNNVDKKEAIQTILKAKNNVESIESKQVDKKQKEDAAIYHDLEKLRTADEFGGNWKDFDGDDELEEHQEALKELKMRYTVRVDDQAHSVYQTEFVENAQIAEIEATETDDYFIAYPEWDYSKRTYKPDYCKVFPNQKLAFHPTYYTQTMQSNRTVMNSLRKKLTSFHNKYRQQNLQPQGDDFDLDAVTDFSVSIRSGHSPSERIYIDKQKKENDLSILLLLDHSLSSDSYVLNNKVIEVEKQVSILFGELLNEFQVDFGIAAFHSQTRNHIRFLTIKDFDESWHKAKHRVGSLEPEGYTRIGAPLRHASYLLQNRDTKNRWVVLLSDGKPNDYDKYEGKYGVNDIKQSLREMKADGIQTYALAIEKQAKFYLPMMFGHNHFQILSSPAELLNALIKLYERIRHHH